MPMCASIHARTYQRVRTRLSILRDGKAAHPQQVQPLLVDRVPTLACSGALCTPEHASIVHLAPHSIHCAPWTVYAHARIMGCTIRALRTCICTPCPPQSMLAHLAPTPLAPSMFTPAPFTPCTLEHASVAPWGLLLSLCLVKRRRRKELASAKPCLLSWTSVQLRVVRRHGRDLKGSRNQCQEIRRHCGKSRFARMLLMRYATGTTPSLENHC